VYGTLFRDFGVMRMTTMTMKNEECLYMNRCVMRCMGSVVTTQGLLAVSICEDMLCLRLDIGRHLVIPNDIPPERPAIHSAAQLGT
jgi:hypothetical protein